MAELQVAYDRGSNSYNSPTLGCYWLLLHMFEEGVAKLALQYSLSHMDNFYLGTPAQAGLLDDYEDWCREIYSIFAPTNIIRWAQRCRWCIPITAWMEYDCYLCFRELHMNPGANFLSTAPSPIIVARRSPVEVNARYRSVRDALFGEEEATDTRWSKAVRVAAVAFKSVASMIRGGMNVDILFPWEDRPLADVKINSGVNTRARVVEFRMADHMCEYHIPGRKNSDGSDLWVTIYRRGA